MFMKHTMDTVQCHCIPRTQPTDNCTAEKTVHHSLVVYLRDKSNMKIIQYKHTNKNINALYKQGTLPSSKKLKLIRLKVGFHYPSSRPEFTGRVELGP